MKAVLAFSILLLAGCNRSAPKPQAATVPVKIAECAAVKLVAPPKGCTYEGNLMHCAMGDMAPMSWGDCIQAEDKTFRCAKDGKVSEYLDGPSPRWTHPASDCPELSEQIRKLGKDHESIPVTIQPPQQRPASIEVEPGARSKT